MQESPITIRPEDVPQTYAVCFHDQCPMFRQLRIIRSAWGFRTLFADVQKKDYDRLRSEVIYHFSSELRREGRFLLRFASQQITVKNPSIV